MKSVLITGASKGLGRALFDYFLAHDWIVFPLVRDPSVARAMEDSAPKGRCFPIVSDVRHSDVEESIKRALVGVAALDLLINNAGIPGRSAGLLNTSAEETQDLFNTHVVGTLRVTRAAAPFLLNAEDPTVVNISSRLASLTKSASGEFANRGFSYTYRIAKAGQNMLSACLAEELGPKGVAILAIHPGQFISESSASGARNSAAEAAVGIAEWVNINRKVGCVQFTQPNVGDIPW